jgi:hypothetical protein
MDEKTKRLVQTAEAQAQPSHDTDDMHSRMLAEPDHSSALALCRAVREQSARADKSEQALVNVCAKLTELAKDWDDVARDTILFSGGYREAVTVCLTSIKKLIGNG